MLHITQVTRVDVPVVDRDEAITFYTETLGFSLQVDVPFGDGKRWIEVAPPGGGPNIALVDANGTFRPGRMTGIVFTSTDPVADHAALRSAGVDVDESVIGGDGTIPLLFFLRDCCGNHLMIVERQ